MSVIEGIELIPCPRCGCLNQYTWHDNEDDLCVIECDTEEGGCGADVAAPTVEEAIQKWNNGEADS